MKRRPIFQMHYKCKCTVSFWFGIAHVINSLSFSFTDWHFPSHFHFNLQFHSLICSGKMTLKIVSSLENLIKLTPDVHSILILDGDGVPIVSAGEEIRNRSQYSISYISLVEQAKKLGMGDQKFWVFRYEMNQVVLLRRGVFAVFIMASASANMGILCSMSTQLEPILEECKVIVNEVINGQMAGQSPR